MDKRGQLADELIRSGYLKTPRIIEAFRAIDRADFVLPEYQEEAYGNYPLPIGEGQTISQPLTVAFMLELMDPRPGEKILDVGAGSGWQTCLLAYIASKPRTGAEQTQTDAENFPRKSAGYIVAIERIPKLCGFARKNLEKYGFIKTGAVDFYCRDATAELPDGPYDKIIAAAAIARGLPIGAASKNIPKEWREKLKVGGKIVAPVGGSIWLFEKRQKANGEGRKQIKWEEKEFPGFAFVPLVKDQRQKTKDKSGKSAESQKPKDKSASHKKRMIIAALVLGLLALGLFNEIYRPHTSFETAKSVAIAPGLSSRKIADLLKKEGVIRSKWAFETYLTLKGETSYLKPGNYVFLSSENIPAIARDLIRGGTNELVITIPEGWSTYDIADYLNSKNIAERKDFLALVDSRGAQNFVNQFAFLKDKKATAGLEGYLFPDTYRIFKDTKPQDIVEKMLKNFDEKLTPDLRQEISKQGKTVYEIVTLASLIEKEVTSQNDQAIVSGILWKRLDAGIPLQVDATIIYLTGGKSTAISSKDKQVDSPYNTYKYRGLPAGPISNPGLSAIRAAIYPKKSPYLYYLSTPDGKTIFSETLEEHNLAVVKYLR